MKAVVVTETRSALWDFLELTKPRLTFFVLVVVFISGTLASAGTLDLVVLFHAVSGAALVGGGASALNMVFERRHDAKMARTWDRPLPSGRLRPVEAAAFGWALSLLGTVQLLLATTPMAALCAVATLVLYIGVYTPLKRITTLNTHIGAISGALPALLGWAAVRGSLDAGAWSLFWIVYFWQIPHFLSIAWLYREDYERGGFKMLPLIDPSGVVTGRQAIVGAVALLPISLLPAHLHLAGPLFTVGALLLGGAFLWRAVQFARSRSVAASRALMRASLLYLPLLWALLLVDSGAL